VASHYDIDAKSLKGKRRDKRVAEARQVTMYLAREETKASLAYIGEELGGRDHTTVLHGHDKIESMIEADDQLRRNVFAIREALYKKA